MVEDRPDHPTDDLSARDAPYWNDVCCPFLFLETVEGIVKVLERIDHFVVGYLLDWFCFNVFGNEH